MICIMQNHIIQAFANTGNAIKPVSFIRDLKSKTRQLPSTLFVLTRFKCRLSQESQTPDFFNFFFFLVDLLPEGTMTQHWSLCPM